MGREWKVRKKTRKTEKHFDPDHSYVEDAVKNFLGEGGKIKRVATKKKDFEVNPNSNILDARAVDEFFMDTTIDPNEFIN